MAHGCGRTDSARIHGYHYAAPSSIEEGVCVWWGFYICSDVGAGHCPRPSGRATTMGRPYLMFLENMVQ